MRDKGVSVNEGSAIIQDPPTAGSSDGERKPGEHTLSESFSTPGVAQSLIYCGV